MRELFNVVTNLLLALCFSLLLVVLLGPPLFDLTFHTIVGSSMEPTIPLGGVVGLVKVQPEEVDVGDVIAFRVERTDTPVMHRVVEVLGINGQRAFRTKGDAVKVIDDWIVQPGNVLGRVVLSIPWAGHVTRFVKTPYGFVLLIGLPALAVIVLQFRDLFWPKKNRVRRPRAVSRSDRTEAFLFLFIGIAVIMFFWGITSKNTQQRPLDAFNLRSRGTEGPFVAQRTIRNNGSLPLVICFSSTAPDTEFSSSYLWLDPGVQKVVEITASAREVMITTAGYFPLLPEEMLCRLFVWNVQLAPLLIAVTPVLPIALVGFALLGGFSSSRHSLKRKQNARVLGKRLHHF